MSTLIEKHNFDMRSLCEDFADRIYQWRTDNNPKTNFNKDEYVAWMLPKMRYIGDSNRLFGDYKLYFHAYNTVRKIKSDMNQHHMILVSGKIGKGKSTLAAQIASLVDEGFNMDRFCYIPPHLFKRLSSCKLGDCEVVDEGGNFFKSRNSMTALGKDVSQAFQLVRDLKQVLIVCYDEPETLDKDILKKFDAVFIKVYSPKKTGDAMFETYKAYEGKRRDELLTLLMKKLPLTHPDIKAIPPSYHGINTKVFPIINDVTETTYRTEKRKYLRDHMQNLANKWEKEYTFEDVETEPIDNTVTYIRIKEAQKILPLSTKILKERINSGKFRGRKEGNIYFVAKEDIKTSNIAPSSKRIEPVSDENNNTKGLEEVGK